MVLNIKPEDEMAQVCLSGNAERVKELLAWGVDPNAREDGASFLAVACEQGHALIVTRLIRAGAEVHPLHLLRAVLGGNARCADKVADELHFSGQSVELYDGDGPLLLRRKLLANTNVEMVKWMLKHGADITDTDRMGRTPLQIAELDGAPEEILELLRG